MLCPSAPLAPLLAATASNALSNRSITSCMVAATALSRLRFDFGCAHARAGFRLPALAPSQGALATPSAVSKFNSGCMTVHSTATAFTPPPRLALRASDRLSPALVLLRGCLTSLAHWPIVLSSYGLAQPETSTSLAAQQISLGKTQQTSIPYRRHYACALAANIGFRRREQAHPAHTPYGASLSFGR